MPRTRNRYIQGRFTPLNPKKYVGDVKNIIYRSSWELKVLFFLDKNDDVVSYASEEMHVPYYDPVSKRMRRYFPDFLVRTSDGVTTMMEVKPEAEMKMPRRGKKSEKRFLNEAATYLTNSAKWEAAKKFCEEKGWRFEVWNERDLGLKPRSN